MGIFNILEILSAVSKSSGVDDKQAFHLIQSFAPGEVDFDVAHQVGMSLRISC